MSFADELSKLSDKNKQVELSDFECFKRLVISNYPEQMQLIKQECVRLAKQGKREYYINNDNIMRSPYFNPYALRNVKFVDASKASGYMKSCIKYLLEQEGFKDYDINIDMVDNSIGFFDDNWTSWIKYIKIYW